MTTLQIPSNHREILQVGEATRELLITCEDCPQLDSFGLGMAGLSRARGVLWRRHGYPQTMVLHCLAGRMQVWVEGAFRSISGGETYVAPAHCYHAYHDADQRGWIGVWAYLSVPGRRRNTAGEAFICRGDGQPLRDAVRSCHHELHGPQQPDILAAWLGLIAALARRMAERTSPDSGLDAVWRAVAADPARDWSLEQLAEMTGQGIEGLRRLCQARCGRPPMAVVTSIRLRQAAGLLAAGHGSVASIALRVGYRNPAAFAAAFRRMQGRRPRDLLPQQ